MFETKLKTQKLWKNIKLRKNKEKTGQQVQEKSIFTLATSWFLKILVLSFFALIILFPFFFMISISLMSKNEALDLTNHFKLIPKEAIWDNYRIAVEPQGNKVSYWSAFWLTTSNVLFSIVFKIFITMLCGYAFSLKKWRGKEFVWAIFMSLLALPEVALLTGQYGVTVWINKKTNMMNNYLGLVTIIALPFMASVFNSLMYRNAFEAIPSRIKEVAMIDGAGGAKYLFKIAIPMVSPTTLTIIILTALASWNSYLWPNVVSNLAGTKNAIMSVWLFGVGQDPVEATRVYQSIKMAGAVLVILPMFILYFLFRKRIMSAISRQGSTIKG